MLKSLAFLTLGLVSAAAMPSSCAMEPAPVEDPISEPVEPGEPVGAEVCEAYAPMAGCPCAVDESIGCLDDGLVHEEAWICDGGAWVDEYGTARADELFCGHPDLVYNYCAWIEDHALANCTVKSQ